MHRDLLMGSERCYSTVRHLPGTPEEEDRFFCLFKSTSFPADQLLWRAQLRISGFTPDIITTRLASRAETKKRRRCHRLHLNRCGIKTSLWVNRLTAARRKRVLSRQETVGGASFVSSYQPAELAWANKLARLTASSASRVNSRAGLHRDTCRRAVWGLVTRFTDKRCI